MSGQDPFAIEKHLAIIIAILLVPVIITMMIPKSFFAGPLIDHKVLAMQKPNILFIQIDSLRADYLKRYGFPTSTAPFMESLFDRGVVFEKAIAPAYLTFQTDAAIFSGLYPSQNNVQTWSTPVRSDITLLPRILNVHGYQTEAYVSPSLYPHFELFKDFGRYEYERSNKSVLPNSKRILASLPSRHANVPYFTFWHIYDVHMPYVQPATTTYTGVFAERRNNWLWVEQSTSSIPLSSNRTHTYLLKKIMAT
jgi:predicted AlkP superfamily pyrophosphatase or phosphodiesterase